MASSESADTNAKSLDEYLRINCPGVQLPETSYNCLSDYYNKMNQFVEETKELTSSCPDKTTLVLTPQSLPADIEEFLRVKYPELDIHELLSKICNTINNANIQVNQEKHDIIASKFSAILMYFLTQTCQMAKKMLEEADLADPIRAAIYRKLESQGYAISGIVINNMCDILTIFKDLDHYNAPELSTIGNNTISMIWPAHDISCIITDKSFIIMTKDECQSYDSHNHFDPANLRYLAQELNKKFN